MSAFAHEGPTCRGWFVCLRGALASRHGARSTERVRVRCGPTRQPSRGRRRGPTHPKKRPKVTGKTQTPEKFFSRCAHMNVQTRRAVAGSSTRSSALFGLAPAEHCARTRLVIPARSIVRARLNAARCADADADADAPLAQLFSVRAPSFFSRVSRPRGPLRRLAGGPVPGEKAGQKKAHERRLFLVSAAARCVSARRGAAAAVQAWVGGARQASGARRRRWGALRPPC